MRWAKKNPRDTCIIKRFILFPREIGNTVVWLEWVKIRQKYIYTYNQYINDGWVDKEIIKE